MVLSNRLAGRLRAFVWLGLLFFVAVGLGCGGGKSGAKVSGTVTYKGKPLPVGNVTFFDAKKEIVGSSAIKDGVYSMTGVPPGKVTISIVTPPAIKADPNHPAPKDMPGEAPAQVVPIPPQYNSPEKSGLSYDVKPGKHEYQIDLR